ncbi:MAG: FG-GAP-like repeat-containing protein [Planctomycetota bacterium]|nr:FG-GAP-like repeat-containing protein [Planctomycetota bacterium]
MHDVRTTAMCALCLLTASVCAAEDARLRRLPYSNPGLTVDLGVGLWAWPLPMDYDGDGDMDLVVSCPDKPYNGTYFFENPGGDRQMPVFKPAVRLGKGHANIQVSFVDGQPRVLIPGAEIESLHPSAPGSEDAFAATRNIYPTPWVHQHDQVRKIRANQWRYVDYDGDGRLDIVVGVEDWEQYGWDNAFDEAGNWVRDPLHGYVYLLHNVGSTEQPKYEDPVELTAAGETIDGFGMPSPSFADFDGDGDLDLVTGEFLDGFTYYENVGSRTEPDYAKGGRLDVRMDLQMITPVGIDWDSDGDVDLICGDEDGRVAFIEHTGNVKDGVPAFAEPRYFQQQAADVKFGALVSPFGVDWDGDGDDDLICGNTAGYIGFIENLGDGEGGTPRWAEPVRLEADGQTIRIMAGPNGSIQGPAEAKWGYTTLTVADWDGDEILDIVANGIWGKPVWYANVGTKSEPKLAAAEPIEVAWDAAPPKPAWNWWNPKSNELATQWRTTPCAADWNGDGLTDLVMLDHEGFLAFFERIRKGDALALLPGKRIFVSEKGDPLQLSLGDAGKSGRRKLCLVDWDRDGATDLLINSVNASFYRNVSKEADVGSGRVVLKDMGLVDSRVLAGHDTSPTVVDWNADGTPDLVLGAEDGFLYYLPNPHK